MGLPRTDRVIDKVRPMVLSNQVMVVVEATVNYEALYPELYAIYFADYPSSV